MTEIDLTKYKKDEEKQRINKKKQNKIENIQINEEIEPVKPKQIDPIRLIKYANSHKKELAQCLPKPYQEQIQKQNQIQKQMQLESKYNDFQRKEAYKEILHEKKKRKALQEERNKIRDSKQVNEFKNSILQTFTLPYRNNVYKQKILSQKLKQNEVINEIVTENIILDTLFNTSNKIKLPLMVISEYLQTEDEYKCMLVRQKLLEQAKTEPVQKPVQEPVPEPEPEKKE